MVAVVDKDNCVGCGACVDVCPNEAIKMVDGIAVIDPDACIDCGACVDACPNGAISMK
jgi:ferredoxin